LVALAVITATAETVRMADEFMICRLVALVGDHLDWFLLWDLQNNQVLPPGRIGPTPQRLIRGKI